MRQSVIIIILIINVLATQAQTFRAEATLPAVHADGFYRILLSPDAAPYPNREFSNVRLYDATNKEVPYVLREEKPVYIQEQFHDYTIVEKKQSSGCCTTLILQVAGKTPINNINLLIRNADVTKQATLSGSDNGKEWFAIRDKFYFQSIDNATEAADMETVHFPLSNYAYYSLTINDSSSAPLNVIKAGYYDTSVSEGIYTQVTARSMVTADSAKQKKTYIYLQYDTLRLLDKLELAMTGAPYFLRDVQVYQRATRFAKKGSHDYCAPVTSFQIRSGQTAVVDLPMLKTRELMLAIDNQDNPTLTVSTVKVYQLNRYIVAWLKKGETYSIKFGEDAMASPSYDLAFFQDSIAYQPDVLRIGAIREHHETTAKTESPAFFTDKRIIWVAIILVIGILGFMSVRLIRETNAQKKV
ncbi:MAG TPA: hypothetical protein VIM75_20785 [Ohtaekwangia sp.]|uniref:hypothetical protein n=1 Tax=Ohtaekwangia sp. TaxID=2066019 RepID=UPI002F958352